MANSIKSSKREIRQSENKGKDMKWDRIKKKLYHALQSTIKDSKFGSQLPMSQWFVISLR